MSHAEQRGFFAAVAEANQHAIAGAKVLEIGSYDVNGTIRALFSDSAEYVGVDLAHGPGVDVVGFGHELDDPDGAYDVTISGECFEHDPHWAATFQNMVRMTRPGGLVTFSCASTGRLEHGTARTERAQSPGTQAVGIDYYRNLTRRDFEQMPLSEWFSCWRFWYLPTHFDLYFVGAKRGGDLGVVFPDDESIDALRKLMPLGVRFARISMRAFATTVSPNRYQSMLLPLERAADSLSAKIGSASAWFTSK